MGQARGLPTGSRPAHWAFIPETLRECVISHVVLSTVIGLERDAIAPESIAKLREQLDAKVFPKG